MRIKRPCYDKYHRCPGWAGSGWRYANIDTCDGGFLAYDTDDRWRRWKFHRCDTCGVWVLPYNFKWLAPSYVWVMGSRRVQAWADELWWNIGGYLPEWGECWAAWPHCNGQASCWAHYPEGERWCRCTCRWCRIARVVRRRWT